jgi:hypothetical protein
MQPVNKLAVEMNDDETQDQTRYNQAEQPKPFESSSGF